jgi:hypothetical protein
VTRTHFPDLAIASLRVILTAEPGGFVTPELVAKVTGCSDDFAYVIADLGRVHMVDEYHQLTPLADRYVLMCRRATERE